MTSSILKQDPNTEKIQKNFLRELSLQVTELLSSTTEEGGMPEWGRLLTQDQEVAGLNPRLGTIAPLPMLVLVHMQPQHVKGW